MSQRPAIRISIGILARNEAQRIADTLRSLFKQSIFDLIKNSNLTIGHLELICVPNGCTDDTAEIAESIFSAQPQSDYLSMIVNRCAEAGKANAWNRFIHNFSDPRADYIILIDSDISFDHGDVLERLVMRLEDDPIALVSTDRPLKITHKKATEERSLRDRASLAASSQTSTTNSITGQLYCGRATEFRKIWMPLALPVEDGFLAAMVLTNGFTMPERQGAIVVVPDAFHFYDTHETVREFLRHEQRIIVGSVINSWLFRLLWDVGTKNGHVGTFIEAENRRDPKWLDQFVRDESEKHTLWTIPAHFMFKRLLPLKGKPVMSLIKQTPIALVSTALALLACFRANRTLRKENANHFW